MNRVVVVAQSVLNPHSICDTGTAGLLEFPPAGLFKHRQERFFNNDLETSWERAGEPRPKEKAEHKHVFGSQNFVEHTRTRTHTHIHTFLAARIFLRVNNNRVNPPLAVLERNKSQNKSFEHVFLTGERPLSKSPREKGKLNTLPRPLKKVGVGIVTYDKKLKLLSTLSVLK